MTDQAPPFIAANLDAPTTVQLQVVRRPDGKAKVAVQFFTVHGSFIAGMDPAAAHQIAADLERLATEAESRLVTAPASALQQLKR